MLTNDVSCRGDAAGRADRNPGADSPTLVTVTARAVASDGTPAGRGTVISPPGANGVPGAGSRVSRIRWASTGTNLPARDAVVATNVPVMSTTTSPSTLSNTSILPSAPIGMMAELATGRSGRVLSV